MRQVAGRNVNILLKLQDEFTRPMVACGKITEKQQKAMHKCSSSAMRFSRSVREGFLGGVKHVAKFGAALAGVTGLLSLPAIKSWASEAITAAEAQVEAETKLEAVLGNVKSLASGGAEAIRAAKAELMEVASQLQKTGIIGDEVTLAGMQQLATYQLSTEQISVLSKGMTDLLAQQKGLNATQEDAVSIANLIGKAMSGNAGALTRVGITMDENQKKMLETGDATQRAAVLAEILEQNVGGVNEALAGTDQGKIKQFQNAYGDMTEEVGKRLLTMKASLMELASGALPAVQRAAIAVIDKIQPYLERGITWIGDHTEDIKGALLRVKDGVAKVWGFVRPILSFAAQHANTLIPAILGVAGAMSALSVVSDVANKVSKLKDGISLAKDAFGGLKGMIGGVGGVLKVLAAGPVGLVIAGITAAAAAVIYLYTHSERFRALVAKVGAAFVAFGTAVKDAAVGLRDKFSEVFGEIKSVVTTAFNAIKRVAGPVIDGIRTALEKVAAFIQTVKAGLKDLSSGPYVDNSGGGAGYDYHGHALGTPYFPGGLTRINEGGRGEIVDLPSGTRIIPHDVARKEGKAEPAVIVNVTVEGNIIGNRQYAEELGSYIARKILDAREVV